MATWVSMLKNLRWCSMIMGLSNILLIILGCILMGLVYGVCGHEDILPFLAILLGSCFRIFVMVRTAIAQQATARMILNAPTQSAVLDAVIRRQRRVRYKRWVWWTRFLVLTTVVQFLAAAYLVIIVAKHIRKVGASSNCVLGHVSKGAMWQLDLLIVFIITVIYVGVVQCFTGSDVLRWRSFYATEDSAWKTHYREVFDHGLREALCCLGRVKYLTSEEDEVYSVAQVLGDMVTYRATGTGHLELIAGLALFQRYSQPTNLDEGSFEAPTEKIEEAATFHPFAEAAYTGPLLDIGRNHVLFPCAWLYRQGILSPWTRTRRPVLEGDNWWRGHAAAFLRYVNIPPEALLRGRVSQAKCEAAYFIVVLHHLKSVVIAVRGTETPEDLITDGLGRECSLSDDDLDGLINSDHINANIKKRVAASVSHYGHSGIVEAARELFMQIEGNPVENGGFLSSLLGPGGDCDGYAVRIVGHSLGGAIAALLGIRLYSRYPNLHVYAYGPLPCLDPITADACSDFVTSIVYNNEFSSRLSVASVMRLRAAALTAMSQERTDADIVSKLARRFLFVSKRETNKETIQPSYLSSSTIEGGENSLSNRNQDRNGSQEDEEDSIIMWNENLLNDFDEENISSDDFTNPFSAPSNVDVVSNDPVSEFMEVNGATGIPEVFLPGYVIHIVPERNSINMPVWRMWSAQDKFWIYKAYTANREKAFKDIIVAPSMFLDHLPWRCDYAMQKVLEARKAQSLYDGSLMV